MSDLIGAEAHRLRALNRGFAAATGRLRAVVGETAGRLRARGRPESRGFRNPTAHVDVAGLFGADSVRPEWSWRGDIGTTPWFSRLGVGGPAPKTAPPAGRRRSGAGPRWSFSNPFDDYRKSAGPSPLWPIGAGTATSVPAAIDVGEPARYLTEGSAEQWDDVVGRFAVATFGEAVVPGAVTFVAAAPAGAFEAVRGATPAYLSALISNFAANPVG